MAQHKVNCSFCGKSNTEVQRVIITEHKAAICDECILGCLELLIYEDDPNLEATLEEVIVLDNEEDEVIVLDHEVVECDLNAQKDSGC